MGVRPPSVACSRLHDQTGNGKVIFSLPEDMVLHHSATAGRHNPQNTLKSISVHDSV